MKNNKAMLVSFSSLVAFLVLARIIPHPPNFTPVLGMAIFAPFLFRDLFVAIALPLAAMVLSNLILGFHSSMFWVFLSIALITAVAHWAKMHCAHFDENRWHGGGCNLQLLPDYQFCGLGNGRSLSDDARRADDILYCRDTFLWQHAGQYCYLFRPVFWTG